MRRNRVPLVIAFFVLALGTAGAAKSADEPAVIVRPDAFKALIHPNCSHCRIEMNRRKQDLRADDRVLCWVQVENDSYINDGAIPLRFFLNAYRVLSDSWGVFVYDPDAGFARGFRPEGIFSFHGWRNGIMVIKAEDGTLYSGLTGVAFEGPRKGTRLHPEPTIMSDWGFWQSRYPQSVAFMMYDKYKPVELPTELNDDSRKSRRAVDGRLPADTMVLGVWDGKQARAYPLDVLEKAGVVHDAVEGSPRIVLWFGPTRSAAAYRQPWGTSGLQGDVGWIFSVDRKSEAAPFTDQRTGLHWDITGRSAEGGPRLIWLDSVAVKWFAWAAEYPHTSIYGKDARKPDYQPLNSESAHPAGALGNLDVTARRFGILRATDPARQRMTILLEGDSDPKEWPLREGAEVWHEGWWGRLDQFSAGDRVWVWFETDRAKQPLAVSLIADELSEQHWYAPFTVKTVDSPALGGGTVTLETVRNGKPSVRKVSVDRTEVYLGDGNVEDRRLRGGETVYVQTTGDRARLILDSAACEVRRAGQRAALRKRWDEEGISGTLVFAHRDRREIEVMIDHEAMRPARSLQVGDQVTVGIAKLIPAVVRQLRPWRERTQVLLAVEDLDLSGTSVGERVRLRLRHAPRLDDEAVPPGVGKARTRAERLEWLMSGIWCTCGMHDGCAGHFFTLAACNSGPSDPCGMAQSTRAEIARRIDDGRTDLQIFEELRKERGPNLVRPHMMP
jgi:hypothetical protein